MRSEKPTRWQSLREIQRAMVAAESENSFATHLDELVESYPRSLALAEFWASAYADLNRESKYFDALAKLFDMYLEAGNIPGACDALEKLVEIDPYDSRQSAARGAACRGAAIPACIAQIRSRLSQVATHSTSAPRRLSHAAAPAQTAEPGDGKQGLEDLMVQAEIFIQYSLQAKAVERLQKIAELFPGEEERNERLRNLYQLANWWPAGSSGDPARKKAAEDPAHPQRSGRRRGRFGEHHARPGENFRDQPVAVSPAVGARHSFGDDQRDRQPSARDALRGRDRAARQASADGLGIHAPGMEPAPGALLVRLLADFEHAAPDALGGLPLDAAASPALARIEAGDGAGRGPDRPRNAIAGGHGRCGLRGAARLASATKPISCKRSAIRCC